MQHLELWDYRRRVAAIYDRVRTVGVGPASHRTWIEERDAMFSSHPQSPIEAHCLFDGLRYFPYSPEFSVTAQFIAEEPVGWGEFNRVGQLEFAIAGAECRLPVFWLEAYGGGVFVPFKDRTNGTATYGGGRYLLDTVKGADLGHAGTEVILDFNFAYHPSCVHSDRWTCPLAPPGSTLDVEVTAGEILRTAVV